MVNAVTWKVGVDQETCIGSGMCAGARPDTFRLDGGSAEAVRTDVEPDEDLLDVADMCPAMAIAVFDENGAEVGPRP